jgi:hypothetical protein
MSAAETFYHQPLQLVTRRDPLDNLTVWVMKYSSTSSVELEKKSGQFFVLLLLTITSERESSRWWGPWGDIVFLLLRPKWVSWHLLLSKVLQLIGPLATFVMNCGIICENVCGFATFQSCSSDVVVCSSIIVTCSHHFPVSKLIDF